MGDTRTSVAQLDFGADGQDDQAVQDEQWVSVLLFTYEGVTGDCAVLQRHSGIAFLRSQSVFASFTLVDRTNRVFTHSVGSHRADLCRLTASMATVSNSLR